jgi:hypothetical protein
MSSEPDALPRMHPRGPLKCADITPNELLASVHNPPPAVWVSHPMRRLLDGYMVPSTCAVTRMQLSPQ